MEHTSDSQKILFEEWKYRHGSLYKTMYRYAWFWIVLALLPSIDSIAAETKLKDSVPQIAGRFSGILYSSRAQCWYGTLLLVFFVCGTIHLAVEHKYLRGVESRMAAEFRPIKGKIESWVPYVIWSAAWLFFFVGVFFITFYQKAK